LYSDNRNFTGHSDLNTLLAQLAVIILTPTVWSFSQWSTFFYNFEILLFIEESLLKLFSAGTFSVMTLVVYVCGDTQSNAVHHTADFRAQAFEGIETVAGG
jgi:hypothetical protein